MKIILKTDDFRWNSLNTNTAFSQYLSIIQKFNVPISLGFIGIGFDKIIEKERKYILSLIESKNIYPFNHSFSHLITNTTKEFSGMPFEYQRDSLYKTQSIIKKKFNYTISTFGSVANSWDSSAIRVIKNCSDITNVYLYEKSSEFKMLSKRLCKKIIVLNGHGIIENKQWNKIIDFDCFLTKFFNLPKSEIIVFQLHPDTWKSSDLNNFIKIISFLKTIGEFTAPELLK